MAKVLSTKIFLLIFFVGLLEQYFPKANCYVNLAEYNIDPLITISGISGGGSFSASLIFIHSSFIKGAGILAGGPYPGPIVGQENPLNVLNASAYIEEIDEFASSGLIDSPTNLATNNFKTYLFHGTNDNVVPQNLVTVIKDIIEHYNGSVKTVYDVPAGHCVSTDNYDYLDGNNYLIATESCGTSTANYPYAICNCNYESIFDIFSTLYGSSYIAPNSSTTSPTGSLFQFNQTEYFPNNNATTNGFYDFGYAYVPSNCSTNGSVECKLHIYFHGCSQDDLQNLALGVIPPSVRHLGYQQVADSNNVIILFPQLLLCYDLAGATSLGSNTYATKDGVQPSAIKKMYQRVLNGI